MEPLDAKWKATDVFIRRVKITKNGKTRIGKLVLKLAPASPKGRDWVCQVNIDRWGKRLPPVFGVDAISALQNGMEALVGILELESNEGTDVWWLRKGDRAGLLVEAV